MTTSADARLNRLTFDMLRKANGLPEIGQVLQANLDEIMGKHVPLAIDRQVDKDQLLRLTMDLTSALRTFRGVTDLAEVRIDGRGSGAAQGKRAVVQAHRPDKEGSLLWFNAKTYSEPTSSFQRVVASQRGRFVIPAQRLGISYVALHEIGHLVADAAARRNARLRKEQAVRTNSLIPAHERDLVQRLAREDYAKEQAALGDASSAEVDEKWERVFGAVPDDARGDADVEDRRDTLRRIAQHRYAEDRAMDSVGRVFVAGNVSYYASMNGFEQEAESVVDVGVTGVDAHPATRDLNNRIMAELGLPPDRKLDEFLHYQAAMAGHCDARRRLGNAYGLGAVLAKPLRARQFDKLMREFEEVAHADGEARRAARPDPDAAPRVARRVNAETQSSASPSDPGATEALVVRQSAAASGPRGTRGIGPGGADRTGAHRAAAGLAEVGAVAAEAAQSATRRETPDTTGRGSRAPLEADAAPVRGFEPDGPGNGQGR